MAFTKRFSVSLDKEDYDQLRLMAGEHKPPLTLQYVVRFAVQRLLDSADDPQLLLDLGSPLRERPDHGG